MCSLSNSVDPFKADLHTHTTCSDGSFTPKELIDLACKENLQGLSITDHDTIDAYAEAIPYAKQKGILLAPGVEFSCEHKRKSVHILGYDFSLENANFKAYCLRQQHKRVIRNKGILDRLRRLRIIIEESDLRKIHDNPLTIGRPHIAEAMILKGYVRSIQEAFQSYLGDQGCCFVQGEPFPVQEGISIIHEAGGKAFIAHPNLYTNHQFVEEILSLGFDGIECYYGRFSYGKEKKWLDIAKKRDLLISGGSDFHGSAKPQVFLGCSYVEKEAFASIFTSKCF